MFHVVSIHALLAECDRRGHFVPRPVRRFNPRTPCGVRHPDKMTILPHNWFQSTHSLRSATEQPGNENTNKKGFNPRTPCGVRRLHIPPLSIPPGFQSTHSLRSATNPRTTKRKLKEVSIHALLAECDMHLYPVSSKSEGFNPRTPCGVRQATCPRESG